MKRKVTYLLLLVTMTALLIDTVIPTQPYVPEERSEKTESFFWHGYRPTGGEVFSFLEVDGHALLVEEVTDELYNARSLTLHMTRVLGQVKRYETDQIPPTTTRNFLFAWLLIVLAIGTLAAHYELARESYALFEIAGYSFLGILIYLLFIM